MLPGHLLEFTPSDFPQALKLCTGMDGILEVQTYGERIHVFVDDVPRRRAQIETALAAAGISHDPIREIEVRMEEAFISLIRKQTERVSAPEMAGKVS